MDETTKDLIAACKELREAAAAGVRVLARHNLADEYIRECRQAGVSDGVGVRAQAAIARAEPEDRR